jgi:para-nitrobenzyl esterase
MGKTRSLDPRLAAAAVVLVVTALCGASAMDSAGPMAIERVADTTSGGTPAELRGTSWRWVGVTSPGESFAVDEPDRYTLTFVEGDRITLRADCNRGAGPVVISSPGVLTIGPLATTRAKCPPGSLSERFLQDVSRAVRFAIHGGELHLELPTASEVLRFAKEP